MDELMQPPQPAAGKLRLAAAWISAQLIVQFARLLTGVRALHEPGARPLIAPTVYFANHNSHVDFVLVWSTLPPHVRRHTRPVAGEDYWLASRFRKFIGADVFNALMIRRTPVQADLPSDTTTPDPIDQMTQALCGSQSLILFPEGTRNTTDAALLPLKSGLYHLAQTCPQARLVPVWIENLKRVLPKGELLPVPLACTVSYGLPLALIAGEDKAQFLQRAREALLRLRPAHSHGDEEHA